MELRYAPFLCLLCPLRFFSLPQAQRHFLGRSSPHRDASPQVAQDQDSVLESRLEALLAEHEDEPSEKQPPSPKAKETITIGTRQSKTDLGAPVPEQEDKNPSKPLVTAEPVSHSEAKGYPSNGLEEESLKSGAVKASPNKLTEKPAVDLSIIECEKNSLSIYLPEPVDVSEDQTMPTFRAKDPVSKILTGVTSTSSPICTKLANEGANKRMELHGDRCNENNQMTAMTLGAEKEVCEGDLPTIYTGTDDLADEASQEAAGQSYKSPVPAVSDFGNDIVELPTPLEPTVNGAVGFKTSDYSKQTILDRVECELCGKMYKSTFLDHASTQHLKKPMFTCKLCPYFTFLWANDLLQRDHARRKHQASLANGWKSVFTDNREKYRLEFQACLKVAFPSMSFSLYIPISWSADAPIAIFPNMAQGGNLTCDLCTMAVPPTQKKNHIMLEHVDDKVAVSCRHCEYSSPYWTGDFKQYAKHLSLLHPQKSNWKHEMKDHRPSLILVMNALLDKCFFGQDQISPDAPVFMKKEDKTRLLKPNIDAKKPLPGKKRTDCLKCNNSVNKGCFWSHIIAQHMPREFYTIRCTLCPKTYRFWKRHARTKYHAWEVHGIDDWASILEDLQVYFCVYKAIAEEEVRCSGSTSTLGATVLKFEQRATPEEYASMTRKEKQTYSYAMKIRDRLIPEVDLAKILRLPHIPKVTERPAPSAQYLIKAQLHECNLCGAVVKRMDRRAHAWTVHMNAIAFICRHCSKPFRSFDVSNRGRRHLASHKIRATETQAMKSHFVDLYKKNTEIKGRMRECFANTSPSKETDLSSSSSDTCAP